MITHLFEPLITWLRRFMSLGARVPQPLKHGRERYLLPQEWAQIKLCLDRACPKVRIYFYLLLLEGSRMSELRYVEWRHLDLQAGLWYKPITKTKRAQTLALSVQACHGANGTHAWVESIPER